MTMKADQAHYIIYLGVSAAVSYLLGLSGLIFFVITAVIGYIVLIAEIKAEPAARPSRWLLLLPLIIFFSSRALPFVRYGSHPLGYDTGFYERNITRERERISAPPAGLTLGALTRLQQTLELSETESIGSRIITYALLRSGFSDRAILYHFYIFCGAVLGLAIWLLARRDFGETAASFSVFLYSLSYTQFLAYWEMYWKNIVALALSLFAFLLLERGGRWRYLISFVLLALVFLTHKTTAFVVFLSVLIYLIIRRERSWQYVLAALLLFGAGTAWLNRGLLEYLLEQLQSGFTAHYDFFGVKEGLFISGIEYLRLAFFYLPFGLIGVINQIKAKKISLPLTLFIVSAILVCSQFVFYKRILVYFDLSLILFAGAGMTAFFEIVRQKAGRLFAIAAIMILFSLAGAFFAVGVGAQAPLVNDEEIEGITAIKDIEPSTAVWTIDSYYTPWLYGFSGHKLIAPGWGDLRWTLDDWQKFWAADGKERLRLLKRFDQPLLIFMPGTSIDPEGKCLKKISDYFYLFDHLCDP